VLADARGRAIAFALTPSQAAELPQAEGLLACLPGTPLWTVADRGYSSHALRAVIRDLGSTPAIPTRRNEAPVACRGWIYRHRNRVEVLFTQMTKVYLFAAGTERDDIADLDDAVADQHAVDQQLDELPLLHEVGVGQPGADPRAKIGGRGGPAGELGLPVHFRLQLAHLGTQGLQFLLQRLPPALVFRQGQHSEQVSLGEPFQLLLEAEPASPQLLAPGLQFLG